MDSILNKINSDEAYASSLMQIFAPFGAKINSSLKFPSSLMKQTVLSFSSTGLKYERSTRETKSDLLVKVLANKYLYFPEEDVYQVKSTEPSYKLSEFYETPFSVTKYDLPESTQKVYAEWADWVGDGVEFVSMEHAWLSLKASNKHTFMKFTKGGDFSDPSHDSYTDYWRSRKCIGIIAKKRLKEGSLYKDRIYNNDARIELYKTLTLLRLRGNKMLVELLIKETLGKYILKPATRRGGWLDGTIENGQLVGMNLAGICLMIVRDQLFRELTLGTLLNTNAKIGPCRWNGPGYNISYYDAIVPEVVSERWYQTILKEWPTPPILNHRRSNVTFGDSGIEYTIKFNTKKIIRKTIPWTPCISEIRDRVSQILNVPINVCIVQLYPSGKVGIKPHRDREMINLCHPHGEFIAGVSLGQERWIGLSGPRTGPGKKSLFVRLNKGSLYVLDTPTNRTWTHTIVKDASSELRLSLTFRFYSPP